MSESERFSERQSDRYYTRKRRAENGVHRDSSGSEYHGDDQGLMMAWAILQRDPKLNNAYTPEEAIK